MPGIGADIAAVIKELGVPVTILRTPTNLTEKIVYEINEQAANAFIREYHFNCSFEHETKIVSGDVIAFNNGYFMVANITPDDFEGLVVENASVIYKCNIKGSGKILTQTSTKDLSTLKVTVGWTVRKSDFYGLLYHGVRNTLLNEDSPVGRDTIFALICVVPASYGAEKLDRIWLSATEYYMVQDVEKYEYPGLHVLTLIEDTRSVYTP